MRNTKRMKNPGVVAHKYSPSTQKIANGRMRSQLWTETEFEANLGYRKTGLNKQTNTKGRGSG